MKNRNDASSLKPAGEWQPALWKSVLLLTSALGISVYPGKRPDRNTSERQTLFRESSDRNNFMGIFHAMWNGNNQVQFFSSGSGIEKALSIMLKKTPELFQHAAIYKLWVLLLCCLVL